MRLDKCICFIISFILLFYSAEAQKINTRLLPDAVKNWFADRFPVTKPGWEKEAAIITKSDGEILYEAATKVKTFFTDKSKFVKEIKD